MRAIVGAGLVLGVALLGGCSPGVTQVDGTAAPVTGSGGGGPAVSGLGEPAVASSLPTSPTTAKTPKTDKPTGSSASSGTATQLPGVVVDYSTVEQDVQVRPKRIRPFKDVRYSEVTWSRLTATTGEAEALRDVNECNPCAAGVYLSTPVNLTFSQVRKTAAGRLVFTRVKVKVPSTGEVFSHDLPLTSER